MLKYSPYYILGECMVDYHSNSVLDYERQIYRWLSNQAGKWSSYRTYSYIKVDEKGYVKTIKQNSVITQLSIDVLDVDSTLTITIKWDSKNKEGNPISNDSMVVKYAIGYEDTLYRNRGYFTNEETCSKIEVINHDTLRFTTDYNNVTYIETIENLDSKCRLRHTLCYENGELILVGQYIEHRVLDVKEIQGDTNG